MIRHPLLDLGVLDLLRADRERIAIDHDEIGELARVLAMSARPGGMLAAYAVEGARPRSLTELRPGYWTCSAPRCARADGSGQRSG
jgi:hypothetical protein